MTDTATVEADLIALDRTLFEEYMVRHDTEPLEETALDSHFVVTPGGIESKAQAIAGVTHLDVDAVRVENERCRVHGRTAILAGTLRAEGTLADRPMPTLRYLSVFVRTDGGWRLAARSLTPKALPP